MRVLNLAERKKCYQLFSELLRYPEPLTHADFGQHVSNLSQLLNFELPAELRQAFELTELEAAYTGLFVNSIGGTPAPPYGSVYLDAGGMLMGESCLKVAACYAAEDLNVQGSEEPPDFLATEFEFLYYLLDEESTALAAGDQARLADLKSRQSDFFLNYVAPWLPEFCERIISRSTEPLYPWVAQVLRQFCDLEKQQMS